MIMNGKNERVLWLTMFLLMISVSPLVSFASLSIADPECPIRVIAKPEPQFPHQLRALGMVTGHVVIAVNVDEDGFLVDWLVVEASHRDLEKSIEDVIPFWTFEPALENGEPVDVVQRLPVFFDVSKDTRTGSSIVFNDLQRSFLESSVGSRAISKTRDKPLRLVETSELDHSPKLFEQILRNLPEDVFLRCRGSEATFEFFIDAKGQARLPTVASIQGKIDPLALLLIQESLRKWQFQPLGSPQEPVVVLSTQTFRFSYL